MKNPITLLASKVSPLSTKAKAGIATVSIVALGASGAAVQQFTTTGANEVPPIYEQVENHEGRITDLEGRQDTTEAKVEQNSNDIQVIQQETGVSPAPSTGSSSPTTSDTTTSSPSTSEPVSQPAPEPTPEPTPHPRTITAVSDTPNGNGTHTCDYTLYDKVQDAKSGVYIQSDGSPCYKVGEVLPY